MDKFFVIGGQYVKYNHGGAPTLLGAKRLAKKCEDLWDNWQGWHTPAIYAAEDCAKANTFYGEQVIPKPYTQPVAVWNGKRWQAPNETY